MNNEITAVFFSPAQAAKAVDALQAAGVEKDEISLLSGAGGPRHLVVSDKTRFVEYAAKAAAICGVGGGVLLAMAAVTALGEEYGSVGLLVMGLAGVGAGALLGAICGGMAGLTQRKFELAFEDSNPAEKRTIVVGVDTRRHEANQIRDSIKRFGPSRMA
ncbi:hypothetical protein [Sphingobium sp. BS19]|uniref:hypothetical protein n=1 Tax=Sphingobium sp. BS19 TaxID=3018973 RepID=UPI0022EEB97E|nr:hypothetical protein [Sphingobium sp. BS19]GLI98965.1 hypothetical protein Sbs19_27830 [Sphingobium sp. BS19]